MSAEDAVPATAASLDAQLQQGLEEIKLELGRLQRKTLLDYLALLEKWNRVYNLTAIRGAERIVSGHLLDCLAIVPLLRGNQALDVGSGAGFPGIPLAIARPAMHVTLIDSNHKKTAFLQQAITELGCDNASVICERVEAWQPQEKFDVIVSRALAELAEFVTLTKHLLAPGGVLAAMKGVHPYDEIERLPQGFKVKKVHRLSVPGLDAERHLVLVERA